VSSIIVGGAQFALSWETREIRVLESGRANAMSPAP